MKGKSLGWDLDPRPLPYQANCSIENQELWRNFANYLTTKLSNDTAKVTLSYAKKYSYVLVESNGQDLLSMSTDKRLLVMKALANLSKFLGCYDHWKSIRERYQLKWSTEDSLQTFNSIFNGTENLTAMISWLKNTCAALPKSFSNILIYDTLTGLRPDEACQSLAIVQTDLEHYLKKESMVLEHYKYPKIFLRRTKKAYISLVSDSVLKTANQSSNVGYNALRLAVKRRGLDMHMAYCRKIFNTHLRMNGLEPEIVDLFCGRVPRSVFGKFYFRPNFEYEKIRKVVESLYVSIT